MPNYNDSYIDVKGSDNNIYLVEIAIVRGIKTTMIYLIT